MSRLRFVAVFLLAWVACCVSVGQGLVWQKSLPGPVPRMDVASNGDLFVFSLPRNYFGGVLFNMRRYSSSGQLISEADTDWVTTETVYRSFIAIRGSTIYCVVTRSTDDGSVRTMYARYSIANNSWSIPRPIDYDGYRDTTSVAFGDNHFVIMGKANLQGTTCYYRKVRLSDGEPVSGTEYAGSAGSVVRNGPDTFVASRAFYDGVNSILYVMRISAVLFTSSASVTGALKDPLCTLSDDRSTAYTVGFKDAATTYMRSFNMATSVFGPGLQTTLGGISYGVFDLQPLGDSAACFVLNAGGFGTTFYRLTSNNFSSTPVSFISQYTGRLCRDVNGNMVLALGAGSVSERSLQIVRVHRTTAQVMNDFTYQFPQRVGHVFDIFVDSTGSVRTLFGLNDGSEYYESNVALINPAAISIQGPYTIGGQSALGTVTLAQAAPIGGATFLLYSNNAAATVPTSVTVLAGATSANFNITTTAVAANAKPTINARYDGLNLQTNFDLAAPLIQSVSATPQVQYGGLTSTGTVTLTGPAPTGGKVVTLSSSNTARVTVPASVTVLAGQTSANFTITNIPTLANASSVISATTGAVTKTVFVAVNAPFLTTATLAQTTLRGGLSTSMTLNLNAPAPASFTIALISGAPTLVQLPSSFAIPQNTTTANVPVNTSAVTSTISVTLVAHRGPHVKVMTLTLTP